MNENYSEDDARRQTESEVWPPPPSVSRPSATKPSHRSKIGVLSVWCSTIGFLGWVGACVRTGMQIKPPVNPSMTVSLNTPFDGICSFSMIAGCFLGAALGLLSWRCFTGRLGFAISFLWIPMLQIFVILTGVAEA